eukprot:snap_masked-scaffold_9-processed-gene-0.22-mRNA-1 protein AED:1.00 eAED:1.00 QI:0/0/0/0/1/1/2/0/63
MNIRINKPIRLETNDGHSKFPLRQKKTVKWNLDSNAPSIRTQRCMYPEKTESCTCGVKIVICP